MEPRESLYRLGRRRAHRYRARRSAARGRAAARAVTSQLKRATETLDIVLRELGQKSLPVERSWRLNERHYGSLEGLDKSAFAAAHGEDNIGAGEVSGTEKKELRFCKSSQDMLSTGSQTMVSFTIIHDNGRNHEFPIPE